MARYRVYDHRIKQAIARTRNPDLFPALNIPRSSAMTWIRDGVREVVTNTDLDIDRVDLLQKKASWSDSPLEYSDFKFNIIACPTPARKPSSLIKSRKPQKFCL